jgi:uncharacterized membrane protein
VAVNAIPKRALWLLVASLALNLFLVGAWSARYWLRRDFAANAGNSGALNAHTFLRRSGIKETDPGMQAIVQAQRTTVRQRMHELSEARAQVRAILQTEPFDGAKLDAALEVVRTRTSDMQRDMHAGVSAIARATNADHRREMADALWPRPGGGRGRAHW